MADIGALLDGAKPAERRVSICLAPHLGAEHRRLQEDLIAAEAQGRGSIDDEGPVALAMRVQDLERQMRDATVEFVVRAVPRRRIRELTTATDDQEALTLAILRAAVVEPEMTDEQWVRLVGDDDTDGLLSMGELQRLVEASETVNFRAFSVPSSRLASARLQGSDES